MRTRCLRAGFFLCTTLVFIGMLTWLHLSEKQYGMFQDFMKRTEGKAVPEEVFTNFTSERESMTHTIRIVSYGTIAGMVLNLIITILLAVDQMRSQKELPTTSNP